MLSGRASDRESPRWAALSRARPASRPGSGASLTKLVADRTVDQEHHDRADDRTDQAADPDLETAAVDQVEDQAAHERADDPDHEQLPVLVLALAGHQEVGDEPGNERDHDERKNDH